MDLCILGISYKWTPTICDLFVIIFFHLACFQDSLTLEFPLRCHGISSISAALRIRVLSLAQRLKDPALPQLWHRSQLWFGSDPWLGTLYATGWPEEKRKRKDIMSENFRVEKVSSYNQINSNFFKRQQET